MRTLSTIGRIEFKLMAAEDRLAKVLVLIEKGEFDKAIELGCKDNPLMDYLHGLDDESRSRYLWNNDRGYGGQLQLFHD